MAVTDAAIMLVAFLKWEAPDGDVRLCDGGFITYDSEDYAAEDSVFGSVKEWEPVDAAFGDAAEGGTLTLAPHPDAALADWWRDDLENTRLRIWLGETDSDLKTVSTAEQLADLLVDQVTRVQGKDGEDLLQIELMGRSERLFVQSEGNVCSDRFHQSVWSGELGFLNCHDGPQYFAWGTESPTSQYGGAGVRGNSTPGGPRGPTNEHER